MKYFKKIIMQVSLLLMATMQSFLVFGQTNFEGLTRIAGVSEVVYVSKGQEELGKHLAALVEEANRYMSALVSNPAPEVTLLVLSQEDWGKFTNPQIIFGMPHYGGTDGSTLIVAAEDNFFWGANMPPMDRLSPEQQQKFRNVYTNEAGELSAQPFFNLLALHELGHGWTGYHKIKQQRFWLEEVFVNVFLHTFIAEKRPELLPALELLPMLQATGNRDQFKYTTLAQFEEGYWVIGREAPVNYGWYQFRFHYAAKQVYDQAGPAALKNLWNFMAGLGEVVDEDTLIKSLENKVHSAMADLYRNWED